MADMISNLVKSNESLNRQFVGYSKDTQASRIIQENIKLTNNTTKISTQSITDSTILILDHPTQGDWDNFNWATDSDSPFGSRTTNNVINLNNTFIDIFNNTDFVDTLITTASVSTSTGTISFDASEVYQSGIIAKNNVAYKQATIGYDGELNNVSASVSFDGGASFNSIVFDTPTTFGNTSASGIVVKMIASSSASSSTDYVNKLTVSYS